MDGGKTAHRGDGQVALPALLHDGGGQGVLRGSLQAGGQDEQALVVHIVGGQNVGDHRFSLGQGARLVQHHRVHGVEGLQRLGGFDEDAVFRPLARAHHDGHGGGKAQGAGAGNNQHRHPGCEGLSDAVTGQ